MKLIFLIFTTIFCANQNSNLKRGFFIVTDRKFKCLVMKDRTHTNLITLTDDKGILGSEFFWDRFFPKPLMYGFNCERLINSKIPVALDLEGITHDNEVLFGFKMVFDLETMKLFNFTDANNVNVSNSQYNKDKIFYNIFMISREAKNVESIRASFEYIKNTYKIVPLYKDIFRILFQYIKNIEDLAKSVEDDEKICNEASNAKHFMILKTIDILQSLSKIRIPFLLKLDNLHTMDSFKSVLYNIFKMLEVVEEHLKKLHNGDIIFERADIPDKINHEIIQCTFPRLIKTYNELYTGLKNLDEFSRSVSQEGNGNKDLELLSNCNLEKTDKFAEKYFPQLKVYCIIMHNSNFIDVFNHYFPTELSEIDLSVKKLVEFYADKEFADILLGYVSDYEKGNKTDFLLFSKTEYFKLTLSSRILINLRLLRDVNLPPSALEATRKKISEFVIQRKKYVCDHITNAEKNWCSLLKDDISGFYKSFTLLFKEN